MLNRLFSCGKFCGHVIKQILLLWYERHFSASFLPQAILSSSSKDNNSHKDDGLFKAPPPPPKVIKSETIPTRLNQDIVTALKCRKEHKEVRPEDVRGGALSLQLNAYLCSAFMSFVCMLLGNNLCFSYPAKLLLPIWCWPVKGEHSFDARQTLYCLFEPQLVMAAAMWTVAVNLNSPTACVIYRRAFGPQISLLATHPPR